MFSDERLAKWLRLAGPPLHTRSIHVNVSLQGSQNGKRGSQEALVLLDSHAMSAILRSAWVRNAQPPCIRQRTPTPISDASGNHISASGLHNTKTVDMAIGDHTNKMRFDLAYMPPGDLDGYLPMAWLKDHNPDIDCKRRSLKWRSDYCKTHFLRSKSCIEFITCEKR